MNFDSQIISLLSMNVESLKNEILPKKTALVWKNFESGCISERLEWEYCRELSRQKNSPEENWRKIFNYKVNSFYNILML